MTILTLLLQFLDALGIKTAIFIAGLAGGLTSLHKKSKLKWWQRFLSIFGGGFTANYLTPMVAEWINFSENAHYGLAFMLGYGGLTGVEMLWLRLNRKIEKTVEEDQE